MKRFAALVLLMATILMAVTPFALASQSSPYVEVFNCPRCSGVCVVNGIVGSQVVGSCAEGTHYKYSEEYRCTSCGYSSPPIEVNGHYCTGKGGHLCYGSCSCN